MIKKSFYCRNVCVFAKFFVTLCPNCGNTANQVNNTIALRSSTADFLIFQAETESGGVEVFYKDDSIWATQKVMAALFDVDVRTVNEHLSNIYAQQELQQEATIRKFRMVQTEGSRSVNRELQFYNLDAIISMGYRVNSQRAAQFRRWATAVLRQFAK